MSVGNGNIRGDIAAFMAVPATPAFGSSEAPAPRAKLIRIDPLAKESASLLGGPPETVTMRSGSVVLQPSRNVGKHTTGSNEEALVVFSGIGEMRMANGTVLHLKPYAVAYCPPNMEHDVFNTGTEPLRYVYLVAKAV